MVHEALVGLFDNRLALAAELLEAVLGVELPPWTVARRETADLGQLAPTEYRADFVVMLEGSSRIAVVVEVQLRRDDDKRASWPVYVTTLRARLRCDVILLVVAPSPSVAGWAAEPIDTGHPGFRLRPLVVSSTSVPPVVDAQRARASPELAVLSALVHGKGDTERAVLIARAALEASASLDEARARLYADLVFDGLGEAARAALEAMMIPKNYEYQSDFARKYFGQGEAAARAEGEAKGKVEGKVEGKADALLVLLAARGLASSVEQRARIVAERDGACLDRWIARAVRVTEVGELFTDDGAG